MVGIEEVPTMQRKHERREVWVHRIERWRESGLSAREFAARHGFKATTLNHWSWRLRQEQAREASPRSPRSHRPPNGAIAPLAPLSFIEVQATPTEERFELELTDGRRLRIPTGFEASALQRLLGVLEVRP
jgi:hypothetical protein